MFILAINYRVVCRDNYIGNYINILLVVYMAVYIGINKLINCIDVYRSVRRAVCTGDCVDICRAVCRAIYVDDYRAFVTDYWPLPQSHPISLIYYSVLAIYLISPFVLLPAPFLVYI